MKQDDEGASRIASANLTDQFLELSDVALLRHDWWRRVRNSTRLRALVYKCHHENFRPAMPEEVFFAHADLDPDDAFSSSDLVEYILAEEPSLLVELFENYPVINVCMEDDTVHKIGAIDLLCYKITYVEYSALSFSATDLLLSLSWASGQGGITMIWNPVTRSWMWQTDDHFGHVIATVPGTCLYVMVSSYESYGHPQTDWLYLFELTSQVRLRGYPIDSKWHVGSWGGLWSLPPILGASDHNQQPFIVEEDPIACSSFNLFEDNSIAIYFDEKNREIQVKARTHEGRAIYFRVSFNEL